MTRVRLQVRMILQLPTARVPCGEDVEKTLDYNFASFGVAVGSWQRLEFLASSRRALRILCA